MNLVNCLDNLINLFTSLYPIILINKYVKHPSIPADISLTSFQEFIIN